MIQFLFFTLCVMYSGGNDCSYEWEIIQDRELFNESYTTYSKKTINVDSVQGFTVYAEKLVVVRDVKTLLHEIKHVVCNLELEIDYTFEIRFCHFKIDLFAFIWQNMEADGRVNPVPTPEVSEKVAFTELLYCNKSFHATRCGE